MLLDTRNTGIESFEIWIRKPSVSLPSPVFVVDTHPEHQYLNLVKDILANGSFRGNERTGTGTYAVFGRTMRFSLDNWTIPLLTTKKVNWNAIVQELLMFIAGDTDTSKLSAKGIKIWEGNTSRKFLDSMGLSNYKEGDAGPIYGFQWRHWGAIYRGCDADYKDIGVDQLSQVTDKIRNKPQDRRLIVSSYNMTDISKMALPPCHVLFQFYVDKGKLSCQMYQRSADMGLGVPFNMASYGLLTCMMAKVCGLDPGEFIHVLGDAHIYKNHVDAMKLQLTRVPRHPFPRVGINRMTSDLKYLQDIKAEDIQLVNYVYDPYIAMEMSA